MSVKATATVDPFYPLTPEFLQNPYPTFDKMRSESAVLWSAKGKYWLVTKFAEAHELLRDLSFEKGMRQQSIAFNVLLHLIPGASDLVNSTNMWMLRQNPPHHTRLRAIVNKAFTPSMVQKLRPRIEEIANQLIDEVEGKGEMELISQYAFVLPVTVIAEMLGIPASDRDLFHKWSKTLTEILEPNPSANPQRISSASHANREMMDYMRPLMIDRRTSPKDDLLSALVAAEQEGSKLTEEELLSNCVLLLVAGHETTVNLIGNGVQAFLKNPDQLELLKQNPTMITNAVEEVLRYNSPVQIVRRLAAEDMELDGQHLKKGDQLVVLIGSCNHDPAMYKDADKFDITRTDIKHLSFGQGIHHCLGATLARAEGEIALSTLFKRLPNLRLKTQDLEYKQPFGLRGVKRMDVLF